MTKEVTLEFTLRAYDGVVALRVYCPKQSADPFDIVVAATAEEAFERFARDAPTLLYKVFNPKSQMPGCCPDLDPQGE
jgi:SOS-response transcriptional repressor LexA